jgi:hypothetical protein
MVCLTVWERLLDSLDTPGGHIAVLLLLLALGLWNGNMELTAASMGALFAVLRTTQSNYARQTGAPPAPEGV